MNTTQVLAGTQHPYSRKSPFLATIQERIPLCSPQSGKETQHIVLNLAGSGITYTVGDSIGVIPHNDPVIVEKTIQALGAKGTEAIFHKRAKETFSLRTYLLHRANISSVTPRLICFMRKCQPHAELCAELDFLLAKENKEQLKAFMQEHQVWDFLLKQEGATFSIEELCQQLGPLLPRLYSIASSQKTKEDEVHLTVALLQYTTSGVPRTGVCTRYLCHSAPVGEPVVPIYLQSHKGFTLPEDPQTPIIMVGPGTGVAPFRAFMQEREALQSKGKNWLFFGEWTQADHFFYADEWKRWGEAGLLRLDCAFSRDQAEKVYVQHKMLEHGAEFFRWLQEGATFYVCGDGEKMASDVDQALRQIIRKHGSTDEEAYIEQLTKENRYLTDVY